MSLDDKIRKDVKGIAERNQVALERGLEADENFNEKKFYVTLAVECWDKSKRLFKDANKYQETAFYHKEKGDTATFKQLYAESDDLGALGRAYEFMSITYHQRVRDMK